MKANLREENAMLRKWQKLCHDILFEIRMGYAPGEVDDLDGPQKARDLVETRNLYHQMLRVAAQEAYQNEVVDTGMELMEIGDGNDWATPEDWMDARMDEWEQVAELKNAN